MFRSLEIERNAKIVGRRMNRAKREMVAEEFFAADDVLVPGTALFAERVNPAVLKERDRSLVQLSVDLSRKAL